MPKSGNLSVLFVTTWAFTACFAVWTMFGLTGIPIRAQLNLNSTQLGLLTATPVLTGAGFRLPLGIWTDRFGGRIIMLLLLLLVGCAIPLWISSYASALWQFLLVGLALGLVGASFSVGTPCVARFFPKESRGFATGFFGAGTAGAALNMFVAPFLVNSFGWPSVPRVHAAALLVTAILFCFLSARDPGAGAGCHSNWCATRSLNAFGSWSRRRRSGNTSAFRRGGPIFRAPTSTEQKRHSFNECACHGAWRGQALLRSSGQLCLEN